MDRFYLTQHQRQRLQVLSKSASRFVARKAIALLELYQGHSQDEVAQNFDVDVRTIRRWVNSFQREDLRVALKDKRQGRSGRPSKWNYRQQKYFAQAMKFQPNELGYQAVVWTVDLLRIHLAKKTGEPLSEATIRRKLHAQKYVWKRPRYQLLTDPKKSKKNGGTEAVLSEGKRSLHLPL